MSGSATTGARDVGAVAREAWATRPARRDADRKIAGVAGAIARRYAVDPTLVRVVMVVLALSGGGLLLYLAGWVTLPPDPADPPRRDRRRDGGTRSGPPTALVVVAVVVAFATLGPVFGGRLQGLVGLAVAAVLLYGLHTGRAHLGVPGPGAGRVGSGAGPAGPAGTAGTVGTAGPSEAPTTATGQAGQAGDPDATSVPPPPQPPRWDPLGAAPFAWDLPEPAPVPAPPPRRRSRVTPVTLAVALLAGGVTALVMLATGGLSDLPVLFGVVLAVLGGGLLVGAFVRAGRGLIPVALLVTALTWAALAAPLQRIAGPSEDLRVAPASAAELLPHYEIATGSVEMDLSRLDLMVPPGTVPPIEPVRTRIDAGMGSVEILVPRDADVALTAHAGMGSIEFDDRGSDGPGAHMKADDLGADGVVSGRRLLIDVNAGVGSVEVRRA